MNQELQNRFRNRGCSLSLCTDQDKDALYQIFQEVVDAGIYFPFESSTREEFEQRFFEPGARCYVCRSLQGDLIGGFYLRTNSPGRSGHIANAAYMVHQDYRGRGLGRLLTEASLILAKDLGYTAMQYNMVFSENSRAVALYQQLGFAIIATIPEAVRNPDGSYQAGYIMYRILT